jgi:hypothetical protein|tara:strand:+ start:210 stop:623 length:414 start_codon:yes stop_codon:yes gene_type:complete
MSKKNKQEWISFTEDGQRWMICKHCQSEYVKVDENTSAITCSSCVIRKTLALKPMDEFFGKQRVSTGRPAGWHFMNEFVDKDGNVFHKGKEQPDLKGTLPPTKVKPRKKKKKLTADQKLFKKVAEHKKRLKAKRKHK